MEEKKNTKERVKEISVRTFTIGGCPETVYDRFIKFCEQNAKNVRYFKDEKGKLHTKEEIIYHIGLRILLDSFESDAKTMMLYEKIKNLEKRLALLEEKPKEENKNRKKIKTFGGN